jgi:hypothetical protein
MNILFAKITAVSMLVLSFSGCAIFASDVNGLWQIEKAHIKIFDKDISSCYALTTEALAQWNAVAYQKEKNNYIVAMEFDSIFVGTTDTTEVGIFFTQIAPQKTEVKITSLNYSLSEFVGRHLFDYIEKDGQLPKDERLKPVAPKSSRLSFKSKDAGTK